jgi:hypothetical protein
MTKELYIFLGAIVGALFAYITAMITAKTQQDIARLNAKKDITLQHDRLLEERRKNEIYTERNMLDVLHRTLSKISLENSQTMSYMQSDENLEVPKFRMRYLENCDRLHEAMSIVDIYFPKMSDTLSEIYGQSNVFWGYQENLLRTDIMINPEGWNDLLLKVIKAGEEIGSRSRKLKREISARAKLLNENLASFQLNTINSQQLK